ncbi:MAG TPA: bacillithiol biosynthesis BshC, partial [Gemmatimonadaceae bacterium]|nr:bacillithiol biosynthesis BshC [Gemmatimonadaceae bacterium]
MTPTARRLRDTTGATTSDRNAGAGFTLLTTDYAGPRLAQAIRARSIPPAWLAPAPATVADWNAAAAVVREEYAGRAWLDPIRDAIAPRGAAGRRLEDAARGGGLLVTTGQQPGLFGGALLTLVKALSARGLADQLQRELGV